MTLTIGRCTSLRPGPGQPVRSGDRVSVRGSILAADLNELKARRQQLLGLVNDIDDPVVPVTWSTDSTLDGFYRVTGVSVDHIGPTSVPRAGFAVTMEAISGATAPLIEFDASAVVRTNGIGITSGEPTAIATVFHESASTFDTTGALLTSREGEDGDVYIAGQAAPFTRVTNCFPAIADRYSGMCRLEIAYGGTWYPVVGQQIPESAAGNWRISNSLVRFTYESYTGDGGDTYGGLQVEVWDSAAWRDTATMKLGTWDGTAFTDSTWSGGDGIGSTNTAAGPVEALVPRVLRNSPETVTLGFYKANTGTQFISLDAGAMFCTLTTRAPGAVQPMLRPVASETGNGITVTGATHSGGCTRLTNDANGNRYAILYTPTSGQVNQDGGTRHGANITSGTPVTFGIGVELGGTSAAAGNTADEMAQQYLGQAAWRQRVVVR